ncbi:MAG: zinc-ribbon domain-containing protein [Bacillota bacterium]
MRRRSWFFWVCAVLAGVLGAGIVASLTVVLWRFASSAPRVGGMYGREGFRAAHGGLAGPGMMGFGFIEPLGMLILLGLAAFGLYALFSRNYRTRWDTWPICPNCHRPARQGWGFCPHCGHALVQSAPSDPPPGEQPQPTSG